MQPYIPWSSGVYVFFIKIIHSLKCTVLFSFVVPLLSLVAICCHSLSLVVLLAVTLSHFLYHSLSFVVTRCHSLSLVVPLVFTCCHSLPLVVPLVFTGCHSLSLDVPLVCLFINDPLKDVPTIFKEKRQKGNVRKRLDFNEVLFKLNSHNFQFQLQWNTYFFLNKLT